MEVSEVIKSLRHCSVKGNSCLRCPCYKQDSGCLDRLHAEAANLLESQEKRISELEAQNRWIPVTERLPDGFGTYLVAIDEVHGEKRISVDSADFDFFEKKWSTFNYFCAGYKITHWMSLPKPPEECIR